MLTAIFGGTFNPLHIGHFEILKALQEDERIGKILLMPDKIPPHKTAEFLIDDETRINMCKIASKYFSKCEVCLIEFERKGKSYTYDTIKLLQKRQKDIEFAFVMGGDMLVYFEKWYKYKKLIKMLQFVVFKRTATDENEFNENINKLKNQGMRILIKDDLITNVSSTHIRKNFSNSKALMLPEIYDYLIRKGGYREKL